MQQAWKEAPLMRVVSARHVFPPHVHLHRLHLVLALVQR